MSREQQIRELAYAIWESEGRPSGHDKDHWTKAEAQLMASTSSAASTAAGLADKPAARRGPRRSTKRVS